MGKLFNDVIYHISLETNSFLLLPSFFFFFFFGGGGGGGEAGNDNHVCNI